MRSPLKRSEDDDMMSADDVVVIVCLLFTHLGYHMFFDADNSLS